jgi:hypothetical protein
VSLKYEKLKNQGGFFFSGTPKEAVSAKEIKQIKG